MRPSYQTAFLSGFSILLGVAMLSCSSGPDVRQQAYAKLKDNRVYEYEFPVVWKAVEESFRNYRIVDRDPAEVSTVEMRRLRKRTMETDWIQTQSRDKYVEFKVNDLPQKKYLWSRVKYNLIVQTVLGGTQVTVATHEEVERLNDDGSSAGYEKASEVDTSRPNEVLERIQNAILSAAP